MRWSWKVGEVRGIGIFVHSTFLILLAWVAFVHVTAGEGALGALAGIATTATIFSIVVLHELGHALTALRFGIRTRDITLLPIGGISRLERIPEKPVQELLIALAGPAVNVVLAALFLGLALLAREPLAPLPSMGFLANMLWANVVLAGFNLLPAFPMDGGRVLRALLATILDYGQATRIAASIGQAMAFLFGLLGLLANPLLVLVAVFIYLAAAQEASLVQMRTAMQGLPVAVAMATRFRSLAPDDPLERAAKLVLDGFQHDFPVEEGGTLVGVLTRADLIRGLADLGPAAPAKAVMHRVFETTEPRELLEVAVQKLESCQCPSLPVLEGGRLAGVLTPENVGELFLFRAALEKRAAHAKDLAVSRAA